MKKIILLVSALISIFALFACEHSHTIGKAYEYDEQYHWYPCMDGDCDAQLEKAEHTWGKGEVTTKPTANGDGVMSYLCTVCKGLKQEPIKYDPVPTVSEEEWKNAFALNKFYNVTAEITEEIKGATSTNKKIYKVEADNSVIYLQITEYRDGEEIGYRAKLQDGSLTWSFTDKSQKLEDVAPEINLEAMDPKAVITDYGFDSLANLFDSFTYNTATKAYEAANITTAKLNLSYKKISVKLGDGEVTEITAATEDSPEMSIKITYSAYGTTKPTPPTREEKK